MKVAVIQLTSVLDFKENLKSLRDLFREAVFKGAEVIFMPEVFDHFEFTKHFTLI